MASVVGSLVVKVSTDASGLEQGLDNASKNLGSFGKSATATGAALTASITAPLLAVGVAAVTASTALNEKMANIASLGVATDRVLELKSAVQDMAIEMGTSTGDLADGLYQVISAFGDTADTAEILRINAMAAAAGLATTTDAINLTSAVTKGYGDTSAAAVQHVSDLALLTVQLGQTTFPELASAMGKAVPIAASLGIPMEQLFAVVAAAAGVTGTTSEVITQLRGAMQALMAPTDSMQELMKKLGFSSGAAMVQSLGLQGTMAAIVQEAQASGQPLQNYMGSIEGQTLALALANSLSGAYTKALAAMSDAAGTTQKAFDAQTNGVNKLGFEWKQLQSKVEVLSQRLGDQLGPSLIKIMDSIMPLTDKVAGLVSSFAALDPSTQQTILQFAAAAAAAGPLLMMLGSLATAVSGVIGAVSSLVGWIGWLVQGLAGLVLGPVVAQMGLYELATTAASAATGALTAALGFLLSPIGLIIAAVAALGAAWYFNWGGIREKTGAVLDWLDEKFTALTDWFLRLATGSDVPIGFSAPPWIESLLDWIWPDFIPMPTWLPWLVSWAWPTFISQPAWVAKLFNWRWADFTPQPSWEKTLVDWLWPDFIAQPSWEEKLVSWLWPDFITVPSWVSNLLIWTWPALFAAPGWISSLMGWSWPSFLSVPNWVSDLLNWDWPGFPSAPGWLNDLLNWSWPSMPSWLGGGGGNQSQAYGVRSVDARVAAVEPAAVMASAGVQIGTVNINDTMDAELLGWRVAEWKRKRRLR